MRIVRTENIFLTKDEIEVISTFEDLIAKIAYNTQSKETCEICDNILVEIDELDHYILPDNQTCH